MCKHKKSGRKHRCEAIRIIEPLTKVVEGKVVVLNDKERKAESFPVEIYYLN